jgi:hypothetical protein
MTESSLRLLFRSLCLGFDRCGDCVPPAAQSALQGGGTQLLLPAPTSPFYSGTHDPSRRYKGDSECSSAGKTASHRLSPTDRSRSTPPSPKSLISNDVRTATGQTGPPERCRLFQGK